MKTMLRIIFVKVSIDKPRLSVLLSLMGAMLFQIILSACSYGQIPNDSTKSKHILFTQPLGFLVKDYSLGYEIKRRGNVSYTIIVDVYRPLKTDYTIYDKFDEMLIYEGFSIRPGIKHLKRSGFYNSVEGFYKLSGYDNKLILKEDKDGDAIDVYYLESRTCNSFGCAYKFGYELNKNHIYFSPYFSVGARIRFDNVTIHGKYNYLGYTISDKTEYVHQIWPIPLLRVGLMLGFGI